MLNKKTYYKLALLAVIFMGCEIREKKATSNDKSIVKVDTTKSSNIKIKETFNEEDAPANEYMTETLAPIRANFKRINSILYSEWSLVKKKELEETTEGGEATFYYYNSNLDKITTRHFGETSQKLTEYYLLKGQLSFVLERSYKYNRPIYYDSIAMRENNDTASFDFNKSEIIEDRSYFANGKLLHQLNNQDCGSPFAADYLLEEQKRLKTDFDKLVKLSTR